MDYIKGNMGVTYIVKGLGNTRPNVYQAQGKQAMPWKVEQ